MSLYNKYRPSNLEQIKGNSNLVATLKSMLDHKDSCPHAFLLFGPTGCGKTTIARIISNDLGCVGGDINEVNSADFRGIDTSRDIIRKSYYLAGEGTNRIWIIDECHKMTTDAQNALLKILEEPPAHVYFVLCTTEPNKVISTIRGRCINLQVNPLNESQMYGLLRGVVRKEEEDLDKEVYDQIVQDSLGLPRNALTILEKVLSVSKEDRLSIAKQTAAQQNAVIDLCRALLKGTSWKPIKDILNGLREQEPEDIRRGVLGYCQAVLLKGDNDRAARIIEEFWEPTYNIGFPGIVYMCYSIVKR